MLNWLFRKKKKPAPIVRPETPRQTSYSTRTYEPKPYHNEVDDFATGVIMGSVLNDVMSTPVTPTYDSWSGDGGGFSGGGASDSWSSDSCSSNYDSGSSFDSSSSCDSGSSSSGDW